MTLQQIGPRGYVKGTTVATLSFTPLADRAAVVRRIVLTNISANDVWIVSVNGQEVGRFQENTLGNQQLLGGTTANYPKEKDIYAFLRAVYGTDLIYPIPQGATFTIASAGGATANISLTFTEHVPSEIQPGMVNHPNGNHKIAPLYAVPGNALAAAGESAFASQIGLSYLPNLFVDNNLPQGWLIRVLGLFLEAGGVNTFSGAANHQSVTDHVALIVNGQRMFTRVATDGIPNVGAASAAGSVNTVFGATLAPHPAFQTADEYDWITWDQPPIINPGDLYQWRFGVTGDLTGGADYSKMLAVAILDITETNL